MSELSDKTNDFQYTSPAPASSIKKGDCILIDDEPCNVVKTTVIKTGRSPFMINIGAIDMFEDTYVEYSVRENQTVDFVNVTKEEYDLIKLDDKGNATVESKHEKKDSCCEYLNNPNYITPTANISMDPDTGFVKHVMAAFNNRKDITVEKVKAMGKEKIVTTIHEDKG